MNLLRTKVIPTIDDLNAKKLINWYCFLVHDRSSGVPTTLDDNLPYVHLRFELPDLSKEDDFKNNLPDYCSMTRRMSPPTDMSGVDKTGLKNEDLNLGWKILGESSE